MRHLLLSSWIMSQEGAQRTFKWAYSPNLVEGQNLGGSRSARFWLASGLITPPSRERPFQPLDRSEDLILGEAGVAQHQAARTGRRTRVEGGEGQGLDAGPQRRSRRPQ